MFKFIPILFFIGAAAQIHSASANTEVDVVSSSLPTPQNLSLNFFGQWIIGWGTGAEGARQRLSSIQREDVEIIKQKGTTLEMIKAWQEYYEQEAQKSLDNPTARYRARLMKRIAEFW